MTIGYFDCFAGISGDMTLGALLDAGVNEARFRQELGKLAHLGFELEISKVVKLGIQATDVNVVTHEGHHHRHLGTITEIISGSDLSDFVKTKALEVFRRLAEAEAKVHGTTPEEVHFHEVGAVDAIVDIVGACIGIELLGIERVYVSPLPMGHGFVQAAHGRIPLPAPATVELLQGVPVYSAGIEGETVTPTGAAIVRTLASSFGDMPAMAVQHVGYGAGKSEFGIPNVLRVLVGETAAQPSLPPPDCITVIETNIDDMNPEFYETAFEKLFKAGALDVYMTPIYMKKNRPATLLSVISPNDKADDLIRIVLTETRTFGVRVSHAGRRCLDRKWETVSTEFGGIKVKIGLMDGEEITASPEYEDCRKAAAEHGVPVRKVYEAALAKLPR